MRFSDTHDNCRESVKDTNTTSQPKVPTRRFAVFPIFLYMRIETLNRHTRNKLQKPI